MFRNSKSNDIYATQHWLILCSRYQTLLGCGNVDLINTTDLYARFTTSVICNAIIQNSIQNCTMSAEASRPLCADACAHYAESEAYLASDTNLCPSSFSGRQDQIRADFINCALPADSLSSNNCIQGITNEPDTVDMAAVLLDCALTVDRAVSIRPIHAVTTQMLKQNARTWLCLTLPHL